MTLVDTTVWIDYFRDKPTGEVGELDRLLNVGEDICTCGIILTEVLQGIREEDDYQQAALKFDQLLFLEMNRQTFLGAAQLYRSLRRRGVTIRKPADCIIASAAIERDIPLLHNDRDFDPIETFCGLKVVKMQGKPSIPSGSV